MTINWLHQLGLALKPQQLDSNSPVATARGALTGLPAAALTHAVCWVLHCTRSDPCGMLASAQHPMHIVSNIEAIACQVADRVVPWCGALGQVIPRWRLLAAMAVKGAVWTLLLARRSDQGPSELLAHGVLPNAACAALMLLLDLHRRRRFLRQRWLAQAAREGRGGGSRLAGAG
jgi:hypothetical protein